MSRGGGLWASEGHMRGDMGDMASPQGRGRQRDRTDVFADESQALDEIAKQVRELNIRSEYYIIFLSSYRWISF